MSNKVDSIICDDSSLSEPNPQGGGGGEEDISSQDILSQDILSHGHFVTGHIVTGQIVTRTYRHRTNRHTDILSQDILSHGHIVRTYGHRIFCYTNILSHHASHGHIITQNIKLLTHSSLIIYATSLHEGLLSFFRALIIKIHSHFERKI